MKKLLICIMVLGLGISSAAARVTAITDWQPTLNARVNTPQEQTISCAEKCPDYDLSTTYCAEGQTLESCPVAGCGYYHRCVAEQ